MLELANFEKRYHGRVILRVEQVSFVQGVTWIQGENGSGKSTLFKSIAGLIPSQGAIRFADGISLQKDPVVYRSRVTYSEAEPLYPPYLSGYDLIRYVGKARNVTIQECERYIDGFGIRAFMRDPTASYSSGMLKKVSLAMAFLGSPSVIILDEPLITLDHHAQHNLINLIEDKIKTGRILFLVSSHQRFETNALSSTYQIRQQTLFAG